MLLIGRQSPTYSTVVRDEQKGRLQTRSKSKQQVTGVWWVQVNVINSNFLSFQCIQCSYPQSQINRVEIIGERVGYKLIKLQLL